MSEPLEIVVKTTGVKEATKALDDLAVAGGRAEKSATKIGESSKGASDKIAELGRKAGAIDPVANALNKAEKASVTASGSMNRLSRSVAGAAVEAAGLTRGMGALSGIAGTLGEVLGIGVVGAVLAAVAAYKYLQQRAELTQKAIVANNEAWRASQGVLDETRKYLDRAANSTDTYANSLSNAADKALALAQANKQVAITDLLKSRAELGRTTDASQALTTEGLWERANKRSWNPREIAAGIGATFAAGAALFDGPGQDRLKNSIKSNQNQMKAIEDQILALNKLDINAFADKVTAGAGRSAKALKEVNDSLKETFVSAEYMQAWQDLQDARDKRAVVAMKPIDVPGLKNDAAEVGEALAKELEDAAEKARWAFNGALNDFEDGIRNRDWLGAFAGLLKALDALKKGWSSMNTGDRIGAVGSLAQTVGGAIGGTTGNVISGTAAGAMAGATIGSIVPVVGTAVGAVVGAAIGFIGSLFGSKKAKQEEKAQAAADAAERALAVLNQARQIEAQRLLLTGDALAALNMTRLAEMEGVDASNRAAMQEVYALQDAQRIRELNIALLEAQGQTEQAVAMRREDTLRGLIPVEQELTKQIWAAQAATAAAAEAQATYAQAVADADSAIAQAQQDLTAARNAETQSLRDAAQEQAQAAQSMISRLNGITTSLQAFNESAGGGLSYAAADARFRDVSNRARLGDLGAGEKAASTFSELLSVSKTTATSAIQYQRDVARTRLASDAILAVTGRQTSIAQQQLDAANGQLAALQTVNESVLTVAQATANLAAALGVKSKLTGVANDNMGPAPLRNSDADILKVFGTFTNFTDPTGFGYGDKGYADLLLSQYLDGQLDPGSGTYANFKAAGFSTGGSGTVGGSGGPDSQFVPLHLTPGELVNISKEDRMAALVTEMRAMRQELAAFRKEQASVPANTKKGADAIFNATRGEMSIRTQAA